MNGTTHPARNEPTVGCRGGSAGPAATGRSRFGATTGFTALRDFLVAVAQTRPREEMLQLATQCAGTDPAQAARLRAGARSYWPE